MSTFIEILKRKRNDLSDLELFSEICARALLQSTKAVEGVEWRKKTAELLGEPSPFKSESDFEKAKEKAAREAKFAEAQTAGGSPYLYSLCSVRLWALMEALIDELVVEALRNPENSCDREILGKLKGPLVEFIVAPAEEQAEFLAETLKQAVDAPLKLGVGRFEAMLAAVKLSGAVDEAVRKILFELSQVRNVIVHKSGRADRRLVEACPWLGLQRGDPVNVTKQMFERFMLAAYWYAVELRGRIDEREGKKRTKEVEHAQSHLLIAIAEHNEPAKLESTQHNSTSSSGA
jgi:hypothetical protein